MEPELLAVGAERRELAEGGAVFADPAARRALGGSAGSVTVVEYALPGAQVGG